MRESEKGFIYIIGNMFGYKTSEMLHLLNLEQNMGRKVQLFRVGWDNRYGINYVTTHDGTRFPAIQVKNTEELVRNLSEDTEVIGIEEVQFFDEEIIDFILTNKEKHLVVATALQMDFRGNPFPLRGPEGVSQDSKKHVGHLMPHAKVVSRYPQCTFREDSGLCRAEAIYIQRFRSDGSLALYEEPTIVVGGPDKYAPRCIEHFIRPIPSQDVQKGQ